MVLKWIKNLFKSDCVDYTKPGSEQVTESKNDIKFIDSDDLTKKYIRGEDPYIDKLLDKIDSTPINYNAVRGFPFSSTGLISSAYMGTSWFGSTATPYITVSQPYLHSDDTQGYHNSKL